MNYLAHGYQYIDRPLFLAGTAIPDWLNVVDRKIRAKSKHAKPFLDDPREPVRELAAGILQHHVDDRWFHGSLAFNELNLQFTMEAKRLLPSDEGFRTGFFGHILVELLLDAELIRRNPETLAEYYRVMEAIDGVEVATAVSEMTGKDASRLGPMIGRFCEVRFLADYATDEGLLMRINHVMLRVRLPQLPAVVVDMLPQARRDVADRADELLSPRDA